MSANKIVNVLRRHAAQYSGGRGNCKDCPANRGNHELCAYSETLIDAADLIEQQEAELARFSDCWMWQEPDGSNFVESMSGKLNVLIPAKRLQAILAELAALKEAQRWTPVSERFPTIADADIFQDVEVMSTNGRMNVWYYNYVNADNPEITHWRRTSKPLPAAPEQEDAAL